MLKWARFSGMRELKGVLTTTLESESEKLAYEFSNGVLGTREIAKIAGLGSKSTVEKYWEKWFKIGIVEPAPKVKGRMQRICSLVELGIDVPKPKVANIASPPENSDSDDDKNE